MLAYDILKKEETFKEYVNTIVKEVGQSKDTQILLLKKFKEVFVETIMDSLLIDICKELSKIKKYNKLEVDEVIKYEFDNIRYMFINGEVLKGFYRDDTHYGYYDTDEYVQDSLQIISDATISDEQYIANITQTFLKDNNFIGYCCGSPMLICSEKMGDKGKNGRKFIDLLTGAICKYLGWKTIMKLENTEYDW